MSVPESASGMSEEEKAMHLGFMREAIDMAELALNSDEAAVGCVFVHKGAVIGRGMNATNRTYNGTRHAEFIAINEILSSRKYGPEVLKECDLYVTIEPCIMCGSLIRQFGVRKVYFGAANDKFGGTGGVLNLHVANGAEVGEEREGDGLSQEERENRRKRHEADYEVSGGWMREEAIVALRRFYVQENGRAPEPRKKDRVLRLEVEPVSKDIGKS